MDDKCSVQKVLEKVGGKWKLLIIFNLKQNKLLRFGELRRAIPGISEKVLAAQLRELESDEFINRKAYPQIPPKVEYSLTEKGLSLYPVLDSLALWAQDNLS
ncbi:MAG: helix-turn-helix transcriptional regulator [Ectothiorhodospiraceae bacterium]|nr:helix-turn-helix transcriptional regulator [Ectothiorhodospiraceae bacterium]